MNPSHKPQDLEQLLDRINDAAEESGKVSFGAVMEQVGRRSFGPLLVLTGLVVLAPVISDIPGVPRS
ncbi:MAG TPA: hypothetical protein ENI17_01590 [Pseudomonas xinjiangensis]|uniref:Uncharacterized protein n=2 Tax=root TaxID=1 RepID=A0A7V1BP06_9GAMM|nr:hypothetical protein [Halopseudomonas xinjiangensis]HEC46311.1 hypothetical protein [Halopseudomonas xinjiangensis]